MTTADQELKNAEKWGKHPLKFTSKASIRMFNSWPEWKKNVYLGTMSEKYLIEEYEAELLRVDNGNGGA